MSRWEDTTATDLAGIDLAGDPRDRACLVAISGNDAGSSFRLPPGGAVLGRDGAAEVRLDDDGVSRRHARVRETGGELWIEDLGSRNGTFVNGARVDAPVRLAEGDKIQLGRATILRYGRQDALEESFHARLVDSALRDGLTRLYNKRYLLERLDGELRFARRHGEALSVLMLDVDHFKRVNDEHGHVAGDAVLAHVAALIQRAVRNEDVVARFGGEEVVVLLRAIPVAEAAALGERLRRLIERTPIVLGGIPLPVTASVGVAGYPDVDAADPAALVAAADEALYRAKRGGRNQVSR